MSGRSGSTSTKLWIGLTILEGNTGCMVLATKSPKPTQSPLWSRRIPSPIRDDFLSTLSERTTAPHRLRQRLDLWMGAIQDSVGNTERIVDEAAKIVLLQRQSTACAICPGHIGSTEDAMLVNTDGKEGLAHRFCARRASIRTP